MAGLVPAIHVLLPRSEDVDARHKAGHDELPSLPWRDDLDLVAALQRGFGPAAFRQHVVIHRNRKMRAFVFELAEQRVDAAGVDLARLAIDGYTHRITSLSIAPRSTCARVSSASAGASRKPWR